MTTGISLQNPSRFPIDAARLMLACRAVLDCHPERRADSLSIVIADSRAIHALNRCFADVDAPTDVLSFPADAAPPDADRTGHYLGDIVIAHDYASAQARATAAALSDVLCLLVIHGALHLLGYDHDLPQARQRMWAAQSQALRVIGVDPAVVDLYGGSDHD